MTKATSLRTLSEAPTLAPSRQFKKSSRRVPARIAEHTDDEEPPSAQALTDLFTVEELENLNARCKALKQTPIALVSNALRAWMAKPLVQTPDEALAEFSVNLGTEIGRYTNPGGSREIAFHNEPYFFFVVETLEVNCRGKWMNAERLKEQGKLPNVAKIPASRVRRSYLLQPERAENVEEWFRIVNLPVPEGVKKRYQLEKRLADELAAELIAEHDAAKRKSAPYGLSDLKKPKENEYAFGFYSLAAHTWPAKELGIHAASTLAAHAEFLSRVADSMEGNTTDAVFHRADLAELLALAGQIDDSLEDGETWTAGVVPKALHGLASLRELAPDDFLVFAGGATAWLWEKTSEAAIAEMKPSDALSLIEVFSVLEEIGWKNGAAGKPESGPSELQRRAALCRIAAYTPKAA